MLRADRKFKARLKLVDLVVELLDARAPAVSVNPDLRRLTTGKPRYVLFSKADLANPNLSRRWARRLRTEGIPCWFGDIRSQAVAARMPAAWRRAAAGGERRTMTAGADAPAGRHGRQTLRVMVVGIPNVGKSTLINRLAARRRAAVGPRPGVTRNVQWAMLQGGIELLDTPGVLWPRLRSKEQELELGLIGAIPDDLIGAELLCEYLWWRLATAPEPIHWELYDLPGPPATSQDLLAAVARRRGLLQAGAQPDWARSAAALLKDFREGRLGRFTLDAPPVE
ncbi:MAG: ribosome biogenesis GTPase YlqF [Kiritimatiellaeota bacterium]|nr:ribosome biogenesis GTPase YlqF [Kiritimatiellota bacterium]